MTVNKDAQSDPKVRDQLHTLGWQLQHLAKATGKPIEHIIAEARVKFDAIAQCLAPQDDCFTRITADELAKAQFNMQYLVEGVLVKDQPAGLVGPKKSLKTNISLDLAIALNRGGRFLGYFNVPQPRRVAVMSGESGMATIQETANRICRAAGTALEDTSIIFSDTLPRFGDALNLGAFKRFLERDSIEVVIVDPAYLCLPADVNAANLFDVGRVLRNVSETCGEAGATLVLAHHLKKSVQNPYAPGQLEDIGWAGFQEFFRQWLLLNRREQYEPGTGMHRLWFSAGGSAGHSCLVGLDIFEGVFDPTGATPRVWQVNVLKAGDVIKATECRREAERDVKADAKAQARLERDMARILEVFAGMGEAAADTMSAITDAVGISRQRGAAAFAALLATNKLIACKVTKRNKQFDGYMPVYERVEQVSH